MIFNLIEIFVNETFTILNERFDNSLKIRKIETGFEIANIPLSEKTINYNILLSGIESAVNENNKFSNVTIRIEFYFLRAKKNNDNYKYIIDKYLFNIMRLLRGEEIRKRILYDADISQGLRITEVTSVNLTDGSNFENEFYRPAIEAVIKVYDSTPINEINSKIL